MTGDKNARRPPELLTRDHVARCIQREVREGRGSPHGGVFLDIAWIKEKIPNCAEHIKRKLPSMYHQFKQLADIDITQVPMEIGPTTHYMMGGVRVDGDTQMSDVPGLFAAGECGGRVCTAPIAWAAIRCRILLVFGKLAGEYAAKFAKENRRGQPSIRSRWMKQRAWRSRRSNRTGGVPPYEVQHELQDMMQDLVGIVRREDEMERALDRLAELKRTGAKGRRCRAIANTIRAGTRRSICGIC